MMICDIKPKTFIGNKLIIMHMQTKNELIQKRLDLIAFDKTPSKLYYLLFNSSLTMDILERLPGFPHQFDLTSLWCNPNLTFEFTKKYIGNYRYWTHICAHRCIQLEHVLTHPNLPWDWSALSRNRNITMKHVMDHPDKPWVWSYTGLSFNPSISAKEALEHHIDKPWDWFVLSQKPDVTLDLVKKHWEMPWSWKALSMHPNITYQHIIDHPHLPWDTVCMCKNPNIMSIDMVLKHPKWPWDWALLSSHPNIKIKDILLHKDLAWNWERVCANPNITMSDVLSLNQENVHWVTLCLNPSIDPYTLIDHWKKHPSTVLSWYYLSQRVSLDYILDNPELPWDRYSIAMNKTLFKPTLREIREWWASKVICRAIFECYTNPQYMVCQNRIRKWVEDDNNPKKLKPTT